MTAIEFRKLHEAQPFRPFTICLADGREIPVGDREFLMLSPSGRTAHVCQPDDSFDIIDFLLVTRLRVNGKKVSARKRA